MTNIWTISSRKLNSVNKHNLFSHLISFVCLFFRMSGHNFLLWSMVCVVIMTMMLWIFGFSLFFFKLKNTDIVICIRGNSTDEQQKNHSFHQMFDSILRDHYNTQPNEYVLTIEFFSCSIHTFTGFTFADEPRNFYKNVKYSYCVCVVKRQNMIIDCGKWQENVFENIFAADILARRTLIARFHSLAAAWKPLWFSVWIRLAVSTHMVLFNVKSIRFATRYAHCVLYRDANVYTFAKYI